MTKSGSTRTSLIERLVNKAGGVRSEATIQSDVRMLLLDPELGLDDDDLEVHLEAQVGPGRRIDVEIGCTVIEVKNLVTEFATRRGPFRAVDDVSVEMVADNFGFERRAVQVKFDADRAA